MPRPPLKTSRQHAPLSPSRKRALVPSGMATVLPQTALQIRHLEATLLTCLSQWGYQEIIPPTFEYSDVLASGLESEVIDNSYTLVDRSSGRMLLLRPDATAQIARMVAMGMLGPSVPLRLCYRTTVFRYEPEHAGREREIFQVGAELIGRDDVATDGEIVALMMDCLTRLGLSDFKISLGHVGFFKALLGKSGLSPAGCKRAEHAAARKDLPHLEHILFEERVSRKNARAILETPGLYGQDEVLERGLELAGKDRALRASLDRLTQVYRLIGTGKMKDHLLLDLGELRGFDYYDGVVFDVFAEGIGVELGGGGRYNHLIGRFGRDMPSTGFALDIGRLFRTLDRSVGPRVRRQADLLLAGPLKTGARLFEVARDFRAAGLQVIQREIDRPWPQELSAVLEEARCAGIPAVAVLGVGHATGDEALLMTGICDDSGQRRKAEPIQRRMKSKEIPAALNRR